MKILAIDNLVLIAVIYGDKKDTGTLNTGHKELFN